MVIKPGMYVVWGGTELSGSLWRVDCYDPIMGDEKVYATLIRHGKPPTVNEDFPEGYWAIGKQHSVWASNTWELADDLEAFVADMRKEICSA